MEWICKETAKKATILLFPPTSARNCHNRWFYQRESKLYSRARAQGFYATFTHLSEEAQDWLSRTVFRYHRRAVQQHSR